MSELATMPAVYGIETEYSIMLTFAGNTTFELEGECHTQDKQIELYAAPSKKGSDQIPVAAITTTLESMGIYRNSVGMLSNGARMYIDPSGPEYATPETTTAEEAVLRSFTGDEILYNLYGKLQQQGVIESFQLNRRIVDHNRTSRGIHLNYITSLPSSPSEFIRQRLAALNVAKGAIFGSGGLLLDKEGATHFHHSPRLSITNEVSEIYSNYKKRPLVRHPFKDDVNCHRIETVSSDALNFAWPLRASLVMTNAVLRLLEMDRGKELPVLRKPVQAAKVVGRYGNEQQISQAVDGGYAGVRPLDVMREICEIILEVHETEGQLDPESVQVVEEVVDVADKVSNDPPSAATHVESIARHITMQKRIEEGKTTIDSPEICRFDYAWDRIGGGIAERLRKVPAGGWYGFSVNHDQHRRRRITSPPQDTRAKIRGEHLRRTRGTGESSWTTIQNGEGPEITLAPFQTELA